MRLRSVVLPAPRKPVRTVTGIMRDGGRATEDRRRRSKRATLGRNRKRGIKIFLKREDLAHTGSHKINNAIGQVLLARRMGKQRVIAETGAGQHGVATATVS